MKNLLTLGVVVLIFSTLDPTDLLMTDEEIQSIDTFCMENCIPNYLTSLKEGLYECGEFEKSSGPWEPCFMKCLGVKKMKDQSKCFCDYCKVQENYRGFCYQPGPYHIRKNDCDSLVCTGKVKFFGSYCAPTPDTERKLEKLEEEVQRE